MASAEATSFGRRFRAPRADRAVLTDPPFAAAGELVAQNRALRASWQETASTIPWLKLASAARREMIVAARKFSGEYLDPAPQNEIGPLLLAGHQPGMFHPGVWCKNVLLSALAQRVGGTAINFVVNTDTLRHPNMRVPAGEPAAPHWETLAYDEAADEMPFEERRILDRDLFRSFGERTRATMARLVPHPLMESFWPRAVARAEATGNLGRALSESRHQVERTWGLATWEIPWSDVLELPAVRQATGLMLADSCRLREHYNEAIRGYRREYRIRSRNHPAPLLELNGDWCEAPYRVWRSDDPKRKRLFVRKHVGELHLSDRADWSATVPAPRDEDDARTADALAEIASQGVKIRTRALATTLYARVLLADLFIHGIGGGLYDQVTDRWMQTAWGLSPPAYLVATATLHLPMAMANQVTDSPSGRTRLRDLTYHPEQFLQGANLPVEAREAIAVKQRWIATEQTRENGRERCRAIRQANETLQQWVEGERQRVTAERERNAEREAVEQVARWREYGFPLYPEAKLRDFLLEIPHRSV
jgi:hypothetical protein